ncbi:hypothetical protein [Acidianus manzaensis]|uniref:Uncharacterized protein n=1 Tax=Acidianus manzaensis TaxID=282676 RepID=A0A1W6JYP6_9CREN|nr:hypothetical protein [Acidianus manzaensis]ARM75362.1 hypothetical protein B6F84_04505 [Acidianus manzaensis]
MEDYKKVIEEGNKLGDLIISKKMRKTLGIYYAVWVIYFLLLNLIDYVESLFTSNNLVFIATDIGIITPFIIYSVYLFGKIIRLHLLRYGYSNKYKVRQRIFIALYYVVLSSLFILTFNQWYSAIFILLFTAGITYSMWKILFSKYRITKGKYYDILAIVSFQFYPIYAVMSMTTFSKFDPIYVFIFLISWAYASIKSFLELIDNGEQ